MKADREEKATVVCRQSRVVVMGHGSRITRGTGQLTGESRVTKYDPRSALGYRFKDLV